jgi:hypothetical protein
MNRRDFIKTSTLAVCAAVPGSLAPAAQAPSGALKKAACIGVLSEGKTLAEVGYSAWITAEIHGGDANYLREVSARMDRIINGQNPAA